MTAPLARSSPEDAARTRLAWAHWPADLTTPTRAFLSLRTAGHHACLLESVEGPARLARYSFVGLDPVARFRGRGRESRLEQGGTTEVLEGPVHEALRAVAERTRSGAPPAGARGLPPFRGGWVGWFAYEWATELEPRVPRADDDPWGVPDATFDLYRDVVAFDHAAQRLTILTEAVDGSAHAAAMKRINAIAAALENAAEPSGAVQFLDSSPVARTSRDAYEGGVESLRKDIAEGEIFQAVLSQRFERAFEGDPFTLYRALRLVNPSPHMFYFAADDLILVGSSPERLVAVQDGRAEVVPIAGTRPRHEDRDEDDRLGAELRGDVKERAEHDMLVDLARNDLGRVARIGSVQVREYASLEKFQRVQHLVSRVECDLSSGKDALDALAACFPAGTVSGAPKVRAMELLAAQEPTTRGPYAGCFGYLDDAGNLDMAISIRTLFVQDGKVNVQAGAGVVFDSKAEAEYEETLAKSRALFEALEAAESPAFRP